jgi:ribulose-5-phosphate 4-epimerase/fuculose-1-phosphate aldolase
MLDDDEIAVYDDFVGTVERVEAAKANVAAVRDHKVVLLRHHGVLVLADDVRQAYFRCTALEWRSKLAWKVEAVGKTDPMSEPNRQNLAKLTGALGGYLPNIWEAAVRREVRLDSSFLL